VPAEDMSFLLQRYFFRVNRSQGWIPSWAKDAKIGWKMINARAETFSEKPAFREALRKRRCLIPVDGFYEREKTPEGKNPFFIRMCDERHFFLAGLWERWISPGGDAVESCAVITTRANTLITPIHDRMPVVVPKENINQWFDPTVQVSPHWSRFFYHFLRRKC
jgi:putative SOS response-associated peptidase YedK